MGSYRTYWLKDQSVKGHRPMNGTGSPDDVFKALQATYGSDNVLKGKGGFWLNHGGGFISMAKARKLVHLKPEPKQSHPRQLPWGEYAWIAGVNRRLND